MTRPLGDLDYENYLPGRRRSSGLPYLKSRPEPLDAAWQRVEAALPEGWRLHLMEATAQDEWRAVAGVRVDDGTDPFIAIAEGPTPAAALTALAAALRELP